MESIKSIIHALCGEDITENNLDRLSILAANLQSALEDKRRDAIMQQAGVAVVLPRGFATTDRVPQENKPAAVAKPARETNGYTKAPLSFTVPTPPSVVRVNSVVQEAITAVPAQPFTPETIETDETAMPVEVASKITPANTDAAAQTIIIEEKILVTDAELPAQQPLYEALQLSEDEDAFHFELAMSDEMMAEMQEEEVSASKEEDPIVVEAPNMETDVENEETNTWTEPIAAPHMTHRPYLPESMRIAAVEEIMRLPGIKEREAVAVQVAELTKEIDHRELNDRLQTRQRELSEVLQEPKLTDLKKGISINDRYQYVQNLFRGDEGMFDRSIKTINAFNILPEAQYWMQRELVIKLGWNDEDELVQQFYALISRRFR